MAKETPVPEDQRYNAGDVAALGLATNVDRRKCHRVVPMKVIALGVSRSGTSSLRQALIDLGYKDCYHYASLLQENPRDIDMWIEGYEAKFLNKGEQFTRKDWDQLLGHCQAVTDTPCVIFYRELLAAYPDAKVILTVRDNVDQWFKSQMSTIIPYVENVARPDPSMSERIHRWFTPIGSNVYRFIELQVTCSPMFKILLQDSRDGTEHAKQWYLDYIEEIKSLVPKENLLVMNVKEGWKPLCEFLGEEEPLYPFPRKNDTSTFQNNTAVFGSVVNGVARTNVMKTIGTIAAVGAVTAVVAQRYGLVQKGWPF